jgi:hypothetical protein
LPWARNIRRFGCEPSAFVPVGGLWLDSSTYLPMATGVVKMVAPHKQRLFAGQSTPFSTLAATRLLYLLMPIKSAKVNASPKIFFRVGLLDYRSRPGLRVPSYLLMHINLAKTTACPKNLSPAAQSVPERVLFTLISTNNAQQLGKNGRVNSKKS